MPIAADVPSPPTAVPPAQWVAQNLLAFAIHDRFPVTPKRVLATWFDAARDEQLAILDLVDTVRAERLAENSRGARRKILTTVARYYRANEERMQYGEDLARGLPIATGVVEGACCTLVKQRMEGPGMRWTEQGAQAVLEMRAVDQNKDGEAFWRWYPAQERLRLYGRPRECAA